MLLSQDLGSAYQRFNDTVADHKGRSLRFRSSATCTLERTFSAPTLSGVSTFSCWVRRTRLGVNQALFSNSLTRLEIQANDSLRLYYTLGGITVITTNDRLQDTSNYYHIVLAVNTSLSGASRAHLYINGVECQYSTDNRTASHTLGIAVEMHFIGSQAATLYYDGLITNVTFVDGAQLTPDNFAIQDPVSGSYLPKKYRGDYGTNGVYLPFSDASSVAALGYDYRNLDHSSAHDWTPNGFSVDPDYTNDSLLDSPFNRYGLLDQSNAVGVTVSDGGTTASNYTANSTRAVASQYFDVTDLNGYYWEGTLVANGSYGALGLVRQDTVGTAYTDVGAVALSGLGSFYSNGTLAFTLSSLSNGDVVSFWLKAGVLRMAVNNVIQSSVVISGLTGMWAPAYWRASTTASPTWRHNSGECGFKYRLPIHGLRSICSDARPLHHRSPRDCVDVVMYSGSASPLQIRRQGDNNKQFTPSLALFKSLGSEVWTATSVVDNGYLLDLDTTLARSSLSGLSLTKGGVNVPANTIKISVSGSSYQAILFCGGQSAQTNTLGSIQSSVFANPTSGISVLQYVGTGVNATVGHGLQTAPDFVIVKATSTTGDWLVYHRYAADTAHQGYMRLTAPAGYTIDSTKWNNTAPTSSVFTVGATGGANTTGVTYTALCFSETPGVLHMGKYVATGTTDGPFVYCGFRPSVLLVKKVGNEYWNIITSARDPRNPTSHNTSFGQPGEATVGITNFLANGFKIKGVDTSMNSAAGSTYVFIACAEYPGGDHFTMGANAR